MVGRLADRKALEEADGSYKLEAEYSIELNRWLLTPTGLWPLLDRASKTQLITRRLVNLICYGLIGVFILPCSLYAFVDVQDFEDRLQLAGPISYGFMSIAKYCFLIYREADIKQCIEYMYADWMNARNLEERRIMLDNATFGRRLVIVCAGFMFGGVFFYQGIIPIVSGKIVVDNVTFRGLSTPVSRLIVDTRYSPANEIMIFVQCVCGLTMNFVTVGAFGLAAVCVMHACGQLQVLMFWLDCLVDGRQGQSDCLDVRFSNIVRQHTRTLSFVSLVDGVLCEVSFVEVVGCTLNICFLGYYTIRGFGETFLVMTYVILLTSFVFNIFIFCYIGELLAEQCKKVGEISYMIDWHKLRGNKGRGLILLICMSDCSVRLTAGKFVSLSIDTFGNVIRTSVAYLNMLRTITS